MQEITITYALDPHSASAVVSKVLDIGRASRDEKGSYAMPDHLRPAPQARYYLRQIGVRLENQGAQVYIQPPSGVYFPGSGYGPRRAVQTRAGVIKNCPPRTINGVARPRTLVTAPSAGTNAVVAVEVFEEVARHVRFSANGLDEKDIGELFHNDTFRQALNLIFTSAGFRFEYAHEIYETPAEAERAFAGISGGEEACEKQ